MGNAVITIENLTKDYGDKRGIFDVNLEISKGEVFGYIGTNGSGKTTTIRNMMGFVKPDQGSVKILGYDSWEDSVVIKNHVSYIPGEIAFPKLSTGTEFLKVQAEYLGIKDFSYMNRLIQMLQFDITADLKRMSKGMKQKTAIVAALMGNKEILILDEPTNHLDIGYQIQLMDIVKHMNVTTLAAIHDMNIAAMYCDYLIVMKEGRVVSCGTVEEIITPKMLKEVFGVNAYVGVNPVNHKLQVSYMHSHEHINGLGTDHVHEDGFTGTHTH